MAALIGVILRKNPKGSKGREVEKYKVGLMTMSDGRPYLHELQYEMNMGYQKRIRERLEATGEIEVVEGKSTGEFEQGGKGGSGTAEGSGGGDDDLQLCDLVLPAVHGGGDELCAGPICVVLQPAPVRMRDGRDAGGVRCAGADRKKHTRVWGSIEEDEVRDKVVKYIRAACAVNRLKGADVRELRRAADGDVHDGGEPGRMAGAVWDRRRECRAV